MFNNKKTISPVVATALLIVVSVVAVIGFQGWYSSYSSTLGVNAEQKSSISEGGVSIEYISSDGIVYITNRGEVNVSVDTIKVGDIDCNINQDLTPGVNNFNIIPCLGDESISNVIIVTDSGIIEEKIFTGDVVGFPLVITLSTSLSCNTDLDGDGYISFTCAVYPMINSSYEGGFDVNDNNNTVNVDYSCWLNTNKTSCINNFIINGCGSETVLDIGTGLCWQRDMSSSGLLNWANAKIYCDNLILGGNSNWKLPTKQELISIRDITRTNPAIVGGNNNKFQNVVNNQYWTITTHANINANAKYVDFSSGSGIHLVKTNTARVICVRSS